MSYRFGFALACTLLAAQVSAGNIVGKVDVEGRRDAEKTVIYVDQVPTAKFEVPKEPARLSQRGQKFRPTVLPIVKGQKVDMTNDDFVVHNVYSKSEVRKFNLEEQQAWATGGSAPAENPSLPDPVVDFPKSGKVDLHCNIHTKMYGMILVLQNPFYAKPDREGAFEIAKVPPGKYTVTLYKLDQEPKTTEVVVPKRGKVEISF